MKSFADYISNSQLDELSTNTLRSYSQKAHTQVQDLKFGRGKGQPGSPSAIAKRETGMSAAGARTKKRDDQARASVKREPQKIDPYKPLGGRDQNSGRSYSEEVDLDEAASPAARFNQKVKQAQASHEAGDHKKAKYHLDAARNFMLGINSNDHSKIKDSYPQYKKLRDLHTEEVVAEGGFDDASPMTKDTVKADRIRSLKNLIAIAKEKGRQLRVQELELELKKLQGVAEESDLGDLAHPLVTKHRFLVTYSDPNHTMVSKRKEKQQKHILFPGADKKGSTIFKGDAEPLVKKYMNKQGYRVHEVEHVGMVTKRSGS